jgi:hypothetical protein
MRTAKVFRPETDWKGQQTADLDDFYIGDIAGFIMGGTSSRALARFPDVSTTEGLIGIPKAQASDITVQPGDRLLIDSQVYAVTGPRQWGYENSLTGTDSRFYWLSLESNTR